MNNLSSLQDGTFFNQEAKNIENYLIELRRDFHMPPETAYNEIRTSKRVCEELDKIGVPYEKNRTQHGNCHN